VVRARLEGDDRDRTLCPGAGLLQGEDLGMRPTDRGGRTLPDDLAVGQDHTADRRIRCSRASGGPAELERTSHTRTRRVVGVTSHAYDAEDCNKGGVDTRVDAYYNWLDATMKAACDDDTRVWCEVRGVIHPAYYDPPNESGKDDEDVDHIGPIGAQPVCECVRAGGAELAPPSWAHLFGTDDCGRDIFSRVLYGASISFRVAIIAVGISGVAGVSDTPAFFTRLRIRCRERSRWGPASA
jgi:hypothetical protein